MARIRSIHPGLFTDGAFASLSDAAQIFYLGLLTEADDQGVFEWKPIELKMRLRPASTQPVDGLLSELESAEKVASYEIGGRQYGAIRNFRKFQRPKSPNAIHPTTRHWRIYLGLEQPTSETKAPQSPPITPIGETPSPKVDAFPPNGEIGPQMEDGGCRMEEVGDTSSETETTVVGAPARRRQRLPEDWAPSPQQIQYAAQHRCRDPADTAERFRLHHLSKGTLAVDWDRAFQLWCRNEKNFRRDNGPEPPKSSGPVFN